MSLDTRSWKEGGFSDRRLQTSRHQAYASGSAGRLLVFLSPRWPQTNNSESMHYLYTRDCRRLQGCLGSAEVRSAADEHSRSCCPRTHGRIDAAPRRKQGRREGIAGFILFFDAVIVLLWRYLVSTECSYDHTIRSFWSVVESAWPGRFGKTKCLHIIKLTKPNYLCVLMVLLVVFSNSPSPTHHSVWNSFFKS